jgi:hypothetical protein
MLPEQVGVAHVDLQHIHAFVPEHVPHHEHLGAATGDAGEEAGAQRTGTEVCGLQPKPPIVSAQGPVRPNQIRNTDLL